MDELHNKAISLEEREKLKEKLAFLKKEYHQTFRRLQRSQKAERVKTHVKKRIEEQNRLLSQSETEMGFPDSKPGDVLSWQAEADDGDTQRKTAVTFNLEPEVFCIGERMSTTLLPGSDGDGESIEGTADRTPERTQRSRLKLRRSLPSSRERAAGSGPCEVSLHQASLEDKEPHLQATDMALRGESTHTPTPGTRTADVLAPAQERMGGKCFTPQWPPSKGLPGTRENEEPPPSSQGHKIPPLVDLSLASLESTPPLFISATPSSPNDGDDAGENPAFVLEEEDLHGERPDVELGLYPSISDLSMGDATTGHPGSAGSPSSAQHKPSIAVSGSPLHSDPLSEKPLEPTGSETPGVKARPPAVAAESPLSSCTLVEGLLFPVEYYVRTTRRMSSCQRTVDLEAVIQSHLGSNRRGSRSKSKQLVADSDKAGLTTAHPEGPLKDAQLLFPDAAHGYAGSQDTAASRLQASSPRTSQSNLSVTQIHTFDSHRVGGRPRGRGRGKAKSTRKPQMVTVPGRASTDPPHTPKLMRVGSPTDSQSNKQQCLNTLIKTMTLQPEGRTVATDRVEKSSQAAALLPAEGESFDRPKERTGHMVNPPRRRSSPTVWQGLASDDMEDFEMETSVHRTPKQRAECSESRTRTPRTPLALAAQHLMLKEPSPTQPSLLSCLQRNRGKATSGWRRHSLKEAEEASDSRGPKRLGPKDGDSNSHTQEEQLSRKMLPLCLDVQEFSLPDEEFGFLKREKLKSCSVHPLEPFVCALPQDRARTNELPSGDRTPAGESNRRFQNVGASVKDSTGRGSEDKTHTGETIIQEESALREPADWHDTIQGPGVGPIVVSKSEDRSDTGDVPCVGHISITKCEDRSDTGKAIIPEESAFREPADQPDIIQVPGVGSITVKKSEDISDTGEAIIQEKSPLRGSADQPVTIQIPGVGSIAVSKPEDRCDNGEGQISITKSEDQCDTDEVPGVGHITNRKSEDQFYIDKSPVVRHITVTKSEDQTYTGEVSTVGHVTVVMSKDQPYISEASAIGNMTILDSEVRPYSGGAIVAEHKGVKEYTGLSPCDEDPVVEDIAEQETDHQLRTSGNPIRGQSPTRGTMLDQFNEQDRREEEEDLALFGNFLADLSSLEWQEPFTPDKCRQGPSTSCLLLTPVGTALPGTLGWHGAPMCTPAFPSLGPTPALSYSLHSAVPTAALWRPDHPTARAFYSQKANVPLGEQEKHVLTGTLEDHACVKRPITLQGARHVTIESNSETRHLGSEAKWCETRETNSQKRPLTSEAEQCETSEALCQKRPLTSEAGQCETSETLSQKRTLPSEAGWCETNEALSQKRALASEAGQCETSEAFTQKRPLKSEAGQCETSERHCDRASERHGGTHGETEETVLFSAGVRCEESNLPGGDFKEGFHGDPKQEEAVEDPVPVVLSAGPERTWDGALRLLSQIKAAGGGVSAVDLSTVWWDCAGWRELCTVTASESSICLWKPLDRGKWEAIHTWTAPKVPIMQLIALPGQQNFVCVALGTLDIEEIWALFNSPESSSLSALLVTRGSILAARGLTGRRVASSSGTEPDQSVEVMSLSEVGRILETCVLWPPAETVLSFAEVEGERDALVGTTASNNAVIWNTRSGALLKKISMGHAHRASLCLQAYSEMGLLFIVLSHPHAQDSESSRRSVLSLIAANPKQGVSVHVMSYTLPEGCTGRYLDGDLKAHTAVAVLTTGNIALWDLHLGHCTAVLPPSSQGAWSLVRWCQLDSHLLAGQKDGSVCVYKYSDTCSGRREPMPGTLS